jgi:hypothetical protein
MGQGIWNSEKPMRLTPAEFRRQNLWRMGSRGQGEMREMRGQGKKNYWLMPNDKWQMTND